MARAAPYLIALAVASLAAGCASTEQLGRWRHASGPPGATINSLTFVPGKPGLVYTAAGTHVFESQDKGTTWMLAGDAFADFGQYETALAADAETGRTVYAAGDVGLRRSTDGGRTWRSARLLDDLAEVTAVAVLRGRPRIALAAVQGNGSEDGVYRTVDASRTWRRVLGDGEISRLVAGPQRAMTIYAVGDRVFKTSDGGIRWRALDIGTNDPSAFAIAPSDPDILYAGNIEFLYRSTDGGQTWQPVASSCPGCSPGVALDREVPEQLVVAPSDPRTLFGTDDTGRVLASSDGGQTWRLTGIEGEVVLSLAADPNGSRLVAGTGNGIKLSDDGGATWRRSSYGPAATNLDALTIDPAHPERVYVSVRLDPRVNRKDEVSFVSEDDGRTWANVTFMGQKLFVFPRFVPGRPDVVYANTGAGAYGSSDGGKHWRRLGQAEAVWILAVDPLYPNVVYAQGREGELLKSAERGRHWRQLERIAGQEYPSIRMLTIDPKRPQTLYASLGFLNQTANGLYKSTNGGLSWHVVKPEVEPFVVVRIDPRNDRIVWAAGLRGILRSSNGGRSWHRVGPDGPFNALALDPGRAGTAYAGSFDFGRLPGGVFRITDGGRTWHPFNAGLDSRNVGWLTMDPCGKRLYAETDVGVAVAE